MRSLVKSLPFAVQIEYGEHSRGQNIRGVTTRPSIRSKVIKTPYSSIQSITRSHLRLSRARWECRIETIELVDVEASADLSRVVRIDIRDLAHIGLALRKELRSQSTNSEPEESSCGEWKHCRSTLDKVRLTRVKNVTYRWLQHR